jgi:hypothetical protein
LRAPEREERRLLMKGSKAVLALAVLLVILGTSTIWAQTDYALPTSKTISPGNATVCFDKIVYSFTVHGIFDVCFERLDRNHVQLAIKPLKVKPMQVVAIQWGSFEPRPLEIDDPVGGETFLVNTETGYAEK